MTPCGTNHRIWYDRPQGIESTRSWVGNERRWNSTQRAICCDAGPGMFGMEQPLPDVRADIVD